MLHDDDSESVHMIVNWVRPPAPRVRICPEAALRTQLGRITPMRVSAYIHD